MHLSQIAPISVVVLTLSFFAPSGGVADDGWRRTAQGWEQVSAWDRPLAVVVEVSPEPLHPLHLAALQMVASVLALALFAPNRSDKSRI